MAQEVIEKYRGYEIERGDTNAIRVVGLGRRYAQYFNGWSEKSAVEAAKRAIDRELAKPEPQPVKPEDLIRSVNARDSDDRRSRLHRALDCVLDRKVAKDAETEGYYERSGPYELEVEPERGEFSAVVTKNGITVKSAVRHTYNEAVTVGRRLLSQVPMAKDALANGLTSPDEEADERVLINKVRDTVAKWRDEAYRIGGNFRGPGIWRRIQREFK